MSVDVLIKNGHVVDPYRGIDGVGDVGLRGHAIVPVDGATRAKKEIDASGCYVMPGLIDFHVHAFYRGTESGVPPDSLLATGVTAAVDGGSAGSSNFGLFHNAIMTSAQVRMKAYLSACVMGQQSDEVPEYYSPETIFPSHIERIATAYGDVVLGLKIRMTKGVASGIECLEKVIRIAGDLGIGVCVHITNPVCSLDDIVRLLRKGDVVCHMYQGTGMDSILNEDGSVKQSMLEARERGVIFDGCNGRANFSFDVALPAVKDHGFLPDVLSSDWTKDKMNLSPHAKNLPFLMAKYRAFGMELADVIRMVTAVPARLMGMEGKIGTLNPGAYADVAVFKKIQKTVRHTDAHGKTFESDELLIPQMTICDGETCFCQGDFALL
jgi:predicted amidohydrolase